MAFSPNQDLAFCAAVAFAVVNLLFSTQFLGAGACGGTLDLNALPQRSYMHGQERVLARLAAYLLLSTQVLGAGVCVLRQNLWLGHSGCGVGYGMGGSVRVQHPTSEGAVLLWLSCPADLPLRLGSKNAWPRTLSPVLSPQFPSPSPWPLPSLPTGCIHLMYNWCSMQSYSSTSSVRAPGPQPQPGYTSPGSAV